MSALFLALLVIGDLIFIALHTAWTFTSAFDSALVGLDAERGFAEMFQYVKTLWIVALLVWVWSRTRATGFLAWALLFFYFVCDDSLAIHENLGVLLADRLALEGGFSLRPQDFGELAVSTVAGAGLGALIAWAYMCGSAAFRQASRHFLLLVCLLAFLGVGVDMLAIAVVDRNPIIDFVMTVVEDGGEMLAMSLSAGYAYLLVISNGHTGISLRSLAARWRERGEDVHLSVPVWQASPGGVPAISRRLSDRSGRPGE